MTDSHALNEDADRIFRDHLEDDLAAKGGPISSDQPAEEDVGAARTAEDLDQDPKDVPNRVDKAQPPTPERAGPWDDDEPVS